MNTVNTTDRHYAEILWDYNHLKHALIPADFIFVMCSYNLDVADRAHILFTQNMGQKIVVSGGMAHADDLLATNWNKPEAHVFKDRLIDLGVPENNIIIEDKATNSGENVIFTKEILFQKLPNAQTGLIVQKPYMERRAYATATKQWPDMTWQVTSPSVSYQEYIQKYQEDRLINLLVGDTYRIKDYADKGFQIPQDIPENVQQALDSLIEKGYTRHI